jgi:hypothetical protein
MQILNTPIVANRPRLYAIGEDKWGIAPDLGELIISKIFQA